MELTDATRIQHMIEAAEAALRFASGRSRRDLEDDEMLTFALTRAIEIIGEAASRVSSESRRATNEVPWDAVVGVRHRLDELLKSRLAPFVDRELKSVYQARAAAEAARLLGEDHVSGRRPFRTFHGTVTLDPNRVGRDASRIADEVITHLTTLTGANVPDSRDRSHLFLTEHPTTSNSKRRHSRRSDRTTGRNSHPFRAVHTGTCHRA